MEMLTKHIAFLLQRHDCVIIPKLGGFVVHENAAAYHAGTYTFSPPSRDIGFNPELMHNDGLLVESYMKALKTNYQEAKLRVENDTDGLLLNLKESRSITIEQVGTLLINEEGNFDFQRNKSELLNSPYYGLPELRILPHAQIRKESYPASEHASPENNMVYFRVNRILLKNIAAAAAVIALILCISLPVNNNIDPSQLKAGFSPIATIIEVEQPIETPIVEIKEEPKAPETPAVAEIEKPVSPKPEPKAAAPAVREKLSYYYIIVGSHPDAASAKTELNKLKSNGIATAGIVTGGGRSRIYSAKFSTKEEANEKLSFYKDRLNRGDAWILKSTE